MDLPLSDFRRMEVEEFDTSKLLAHATKQAVERGYKNFPIVDVDSHHYESESIGEILESASLDWYSAASSSYCGFDSRT